MRHVFHTTVLKRVQSSVLPIWSKCRVRPPRQLICWRTSKLKLYYLFTIFKTRYMAPWFFADMCPRRQKTRLWGQMHYKDYVMSQWYHIVSWVTWVTMCYYTRVTFTDSSNSAPPHKTYPPNGSQPTTGLPNQIKEASCPEIVPIKSLQKEKRRNTSKRMHPYQYHQV